IVGVNTTCDWTSDPAYSGPQYPFHFWTENGPLTERGDYRILTESFTESDYGQSEVSPDLWFSIPEVSAFRRATRVNTYAETDVMTGADQLAFAVSGKNPDEYMFDV